MPPPAQAPANDDAQYYRAVLHELIDLGMELARALHAKATAKPPEISLTDAADAYDRISRAVRRSILLAQRVQDVPPPTAERRAAGRRRILREVEDAIERSQPRPGQRECFQAELHERLDAPDVLEDIDNRPIPEIIAEICRDLGLADPGLRLWKRRTPADIAALCARAAAPPAPSADAPQSPKPERFFRLRAEPDPA